MKINLSLSIILIVSFMSALSGSIFNATYAFVDVAEIQEIENCQLDNAEDISLEDVVPIDPFLGSIGCTKPELRKLVIFKTLITRLFQLFQSLPQSLSSILVTSREFLSGEKCLNNGLWLEYCKLRL